MTVETTPVTQVTMEIRRGVGATRTSNENRCHVRASKSDLPDWQVDDVISVTTKHGARLVILERARPGPEGSKVKGKVKIIQHKGNKNSGPRLVFQLTTTDWPWDIAHLGGSKKNNYHYVKAAVGKDKITIHVEGVVEPKIPKKVAHNTPKVINQTFHQKVMNAGSVNDQVPAGADTVEAMAVVCTLATKQGLVLEMTGLNAMQATKTFEDGSRMILQTPKHVKP